MSIVEILLRFVPGACSHPHTYRERRKLHGAQVMHFVCDWCGHATPAVDRTAREHRRVVKIGGLPNSRVIRQPGRLFSVSDHPRRNRA